MSDEQEVQPVEPEVTPEAEPMAPVAEGDTVSTVVVEEATEAPVEPEVQA